MLQIHPGTRYLLYSKWADVRKSFDGLSGLITNELKMPIESGDVFIFSIADKLTLSSCNGKEMALACITSDWKKGHSNCLPDLWKVPIVRYPVNSFL